MIYWYSLSASDAKGEVLSLNNVQENMFGIDCWWLFANVLVYSQGFELWLPVTHRHWKFASCEQGKCLDSMVVISKCNGGGGSEVGWKSYKSMNQRALNNAVLQLDRRWTSMKTRSWGSCCHAELEPHASHAGRPESVVRETTSSKR